MIATHSGAFHADEALGVFMLRLLPEWSAVPLVRTRDPAVIAQAALVLDVGAVYDPATLRFDHHQREFTDTYSAKHNIRLSSAGLIYKHFGDRVIEALIGRKDAEIVQRVITYFYLDFTCNLA